TTERMEQIQRATRGLLRKVQQFCGCEYLVFFANVLENESVLTAISTVGLSQSVQNRMPHFNWKKGGLPENVADLRTWDIQAHHHESLEGIRGDNSHFFRQVSCIIPTTIGEFYRGVLVFGPFEGRVDIGREKAFLSEVARILGWFVLVKLQYLSLQQERERNKSTQELLIHQLRTGITPVATQIQTANLMLRKPLTPESTKLIKDWLDSAHHISLNLGKSAGETVRSHVLHLEKSDLVFGSYPLSVLVANCVEAYSREAEKKQRELILDESIEWLPNAEIDLARLTIALGNLLDNAIKYSFAGTAIYVRAAARTGVFVSSLDTKGATIEIEDLGFEVPLKEKNLIFQQGRRGIMMARMGRIPGTGLGLWETRSVIEAHGGEIDVRSEAVPTRPGQREAHKVTFNIRIPLQQPN
ncbi:MAG: HAMP domain-containing histidine kinase, partial [Caldilineaceae bacterium]|nr:HAMP domain-containing histidine kinase [Caldilineaceae bacterium]